MSALLKAAGAASLVLAANVCAAQTIKLGLSIPLSGAGANWGKGSEWMCSQAAR